MHGELCFDYPLKSGHVKEALFLFNSLLMMNMEEEAIGWNLRGPKRMRKRKELNALVKNQARYQHAFTKTSSIDMFNMNSGTSRLLSKSNDSSSDNDDYYFAANKLIIRE